MLRLVSFILAFLISGVYAFTPQAFFLVSPTIIRTRTLASYYGGGTGTQNNVVCPTTTQITPLFHRNHPHQNQCIQQKKSSIVRKATVSGDTFTGLTKEKIAVIIEVTFIEACLGLGEGNLDVFKLFVTTIKAAYEQRIPIPELVDSIAEVDKTRMSAKRPLTSEEVNLRTTWLNLGYLTLEYLNRIEKGSADLSFDDDIDNALEQTLSVSMNIRGTYKFIIEDIVLSFLFKPTKHSSTVDLKSIGNTSQEAMMAYSLRLINKMLKVVQEERRAAKVNTVVKSDNILPPRPSSSGFSISSTQDKPSQDKPTQDKPNVIQHSSVGNESMVEAKAKIIENQQPIATQEHVVSTAEENISDYEKLHLELIELRKEVATLTGIIRDSII